MNHTKSFVGRVRTLMAGAGAAALISSLALTGLSSSAGASVARYQIETLNYTVTVAGGYTHSFTVTVDPCNGTFTGTGQNPALPSTASVYETLSGWTDGMDLTFTAYYFHDAAFTSPTGYWWTFSGYFTDANLDITGTLTSSSANQSGLTVTGTMDSMSMSNYATHGQYVASNGGGDDAAHSCIGMPMVGSMSM